MTGLNVCHLEGNMTGRGGVCRKRIVVDSSEYVYVVMMRWIIDEIVVVGGCVRLAKNSDKSVFGMNRLPSPKVINLTVGRREDPDHSACGPINIELLALADDVWCFAGTSKE